MKYIILTILLVSCCNRRPEDVGKTVERYNWECLKTDSHLSPGFGLDGNITFTSVTTCVVTKCIYRKTELGETCSKDVILEKKIVDDSNCL